MPNMISRQIDYESEVLEGNVQVRFKIQQEAHGIIGDRANWADPTNFPCPVTQSLSMRHFVATFPDPANALEFLTVKIPISSPEPTVIQIEAQALLALGAVCLDFVGERWTVVPGMGTPGVTYDLPGELDYQTVRYEYFPQAIEMVTADILSVSIESRNNDLFNLQQDCMTVNADPAPVCNPYQSGFKPRAGIIQARNNTTGGIIKRRAIATTHIAIRTCLEGLADGAQCVGYEGEVYKNLQLVLSAP